MTHYPETGTKTRKPVPVSCKGVMQFDIDFVWYRNLVQARALLYSVNETGGIGFLVQILVPVSG